MHTGVSRKFPVFAFEKNSSICQGSIMNLFTLFDSNTFIKVWYNSEKTKKEFAGKTQKSHFVQKLGRFQLSLLF